ncbi:MAG: ATP-binding protein [Nitrospirota bacterium]
MHLTEGIASLISIEGEPSPQRFRALAAELLRRSDTIRNIAIAPDNVVSQVYPIKGNEAALGLHYAENPAQWPSVQRMMTENRLVVAGPVSLVQGGIGVIARCPVHVVDSAGSGKMRYWGLVSTVIDFPKLIAQSTVSSVSDSLRLGLRGVDGLGAEGKIFWGDERVFNDAPVVSDIPLPSGTWQLGAVPKQGWPVFNAFKSIYFQAGSLASALLTALIFRLLQVSSSRKIAIVQRINAETTLRRLNAELEDRVAQRTEELKAAMLKAQEADRLKSFFLATMSHELRTPLNSIIGFTGVLLQGLAGPLNAEQTKQLGMTHDSARHLLALINDVLDISKIEAGQLEVERAPFEMRAAIENAMRVVSPQAQKKGLTLTAAIASDVSGIVSDRRRIEQILLNLLSNAIKFTEHGEVLLECSARDGWLEVKVRDTGIGIKPEDINRLFKPFQQLETGLNRRHDGTGLGLAICRNLVHLLGGQISVESELGKGSTFTIALPMSSEGASHG